ncbi:MAG: hypothetical protein JXR80_07085, partial [Deltaproteobacteria bacterium]|nr:hypothetical protein [Deltaproteobacteria bacterium]
SLHFLSSISVFPALIAPKLRNSRSGAQTVAILMGFFRWGKRRNFARRYGKPPEHPQKEYWLNSYVIFLIISREKQRAKLTDRIMKVNCGEILTNVLTKNIYQDKKHPD